MQGICDTCKEFDERETVFSLRTDMQEQVDNTNTAIKDARSLDITEKDEIKQTISTLNKKTDDFRSTYDTFTLEATKLTEKDCFDTYSHSMDIVLKTKGKEEGVESLPKDQLEEFKKNRDQMRMYSFKQLFNIFTETNNRSEVQDRVTKNEQDIQTLFKNV